MHAAVNHVQIQPGKMNEAIAIFRYSVVPAGSQQQGNRGAILLTDPNTNNFIAIGLWDTEADTSAVVTNFWYQQQVAKLTLAYAGPPVREVYEVSAGEATLGKSGATHARVNYRQIQTDRIDEAISMYRDTVIPAQKGFVGGIVLTNGSTGKLVAIALWESEADMRASQPPVDAITGGPPVQEVYEVSVQV